MIYGYKDTQPSSCSMCSWSEVHYSRSTNLASLHCLKLDRVLMDTAFVIAVDSEDARLQLANRLSPPPTICPKRVALLPVA
jgi:hypothetical protein